jgi:hypothetical protein
MNSRRLATIAAVGGTVVLAGWVIARPVDLGAPRTELTAAPSESSPATSVIAKTEAIDAADEAMDEDRMSSGDPAIVAPVELVAAPPAAAPSVRLASANPADPMPGSANEKVSPLETADECLVADICIDRYLFAAYQRTPKLDTIKVPEQVKVTVKKKGKTRTVTKTIQKLVDEDFGWKDPKAADKAGMSLQDYVIGGMDRSFRLTLYRALRAMEDAGLEPGITSAFRDDYRQALASGLKAATDRSFHGGSRRGGYGHGVAADLVSVKGETRAQRWISSEELWKWIDAHGAQFGIARPYLDHDPPHVGPIDGEEYALKRGHARAKLAAVKPNAHHRPAIAKLAAVEPNARHRPATAKLAAVEPNARHRPTNAKLAAVEANARHRPAAREERGKTKSTSP